MADSDDTTLAGDDLDAVVGQSGILEQLYADERTKRCIGIRLGHHRVSGGDGREGIGYSEGEGVIPWGNLPYHTLRRTIFARFSEHGNAGCPSGRTH